MFTTEKCPSYHQGRMDDILCLPVSQKVISQSQVFVSSRLQNSANSTLCYTVGVFYCMSQAQKEAEDVSVSWALTQTVETMGKNTEKMILVGGD